MIFSEGLSCENQYGKILIPFPVRIFKNIQVSEMYLSVTRRFVKDLENFRVPEKTADSLRKTRGFPDRFC